MTTEAQKEAGRAYYHAHKEQIANNHSRWMQRNREQQNKYHKDYYNESIQRRIAHTHRSELRKILRGLRSGKRYCPQVLGIKDKQSFLDHLGPNTAKYGKGMDDYCIDHIKCLNSFDLTNSLERAKAFHYTNIQLISNAQNWSKGVK